jgi:phosphoglycolate phosphatase
VIRALDGFDWAKGCLLLDFDGPVCSIFAGKPDFLAAQRLRRVLNRHAAQLPQPVLEAHDPLVVLRFTGTHHKDLVPEVEHELQAAELEAVVTAAPTPGALNLIKLAPPSGVAIVSNNSADAIRRYFQDRQSQDGLRLSRIPVIGRNPTDPGLMKPYPHLLLEALQVTGRHADQCVMIGDSTTDVQAAAAAGVRCIGYANKPDKARSLAAAGAEDIVKSMFDIIEYLPSPRS